MGDVIHLAPRRDAAALKSYGGVDRGAYRIHLLTNGTVRHSAVTPDGAELALDLDGPRLRRLIEDLQAAETFAVQLREKLGGKPPEGA